MSAFTAEEMQKEFDALNRAFNEGKPVDIGRLVGFANVLHEARSLADEATETAAAERAATGAAVDAMQALLDLVQPCAGVLTRECRAVLGRSDWEGDAPVTYDDHASITLARSETSLQDAGSGCGDLSGFLAVLRHDGTVVGGPWSGRYWSARGGGSCWRVDTLQPLSVADLARAFDPESVLRHLFATLQRRKGEARELAWRRLRMAKALRAIDATRSEAT